MRFCKVLLTVLLLLMLVCPAGAEEADNLLYNGDFEILNSQGLPAGWYTDAYIHQEGYTLWSVSEDAHGGEHSAMISNFGDNDARFAQRVEVEPNSLYCFSGYVKVLDMSDYGRGANLSIDGIYVFSESLHDETEDWVRLELYGRTGPDQRDVTLFVRVGGYSGESIGSAQFDDLSLRKVDIVPANADETQWYYVQSAQQSNADTEEDAEASPFWPWLLLISAVYLLAGVWMITNCLQRDPRQLKRPTGVPAFLMIGLVVSFLTRIVVGLMVEGYPVDVGCFVSWGGTMTEKGPAYFYQTASFCDYTPGYLYVLWLNHAVLKPVCEWIAGWFGAAVPAIFAHKLVPICCDIAMAWLLYHIARRKLDRQQAGVLSLLFALNPAMVLNSAAWSQVDSVLCLCLMLVAWLAVERKWKAVLPVYVLSALIKPQALMLGPLGLIAIILQLIQDARQDKETFNRTVNDMLIGLGASAAVAAIVIIPYCFHQESWTWLFDLYGKTLASYPHATVNTANLYYLLDGNWVSIEYACSWQAIVCFAVMAAAWGGWLAYRQRRMRFGWLEPVIMGLFAIAYLVMLIVRLAVPAEAVVTWSVLGTTAMAMSFAIVLSCYIRSGKIENLPLCGAVLFILLYVLGIKMHERYLFPALILLAMAYAMRRDVRVILLLLVTSCTLLINEGIILDNALRLGSSLGHLNNDTLMLNDLVSAVNVAAAILSAWICHSICVCDKEVRWSIPQLQKSARTEQSWKPDAKLHWKRLDWVLMLSVTVIYAVVTLTTLGSTKAPQNAWKSSAYDEQVIIDLGRDYDDVSMLYFCQVSYSDFSVAVSSDGETWSEEYWAEMAQGLCFRWRYLEQFYTNLDDGSRHYISASTTDDVQKLSGRYVRITAQQIGLILNEVIFRDAGGQTIPATVLRAENGNLDSPNYSDPTAVLDEQDSLEGEPSWWNGTYFDEIYHARTAYEHLHGLAPYETSHPPLGKVIMSLGVAIFGMTPFGWRFAGAFAGVLMLPVMYVLGKQLTKRTSIAFASMAMMTLDCMHFTQTRIATIDSFPVLFILLSWLFMLRFMQRNVTAVPIKELLPDLALSGFFMGCGIASKWIGIYSGGGLAVVYFWTCLRHIRLHGMKGLKRAFCLCLWCLLFFVAIPLGIYLLSYIPYFAYKHTDNLREFLQLVYDANFDPHYGMFAYHSTPGLGMNHPFYSPWYEWPLIKRPMYYASPNFVPEGMAYAIWCLGNPAVWLVGIAGVFTVAFVWARRHFYKVAGSDSCLHLTSSSWDVEPAFILIGLLAQFLPWVLVPRGTYIYHYFASVPFLILSIAMALHWLQVRYPQAGKGIIIAYLLVCLGFFIAYFPYASGLMTPTPWLDFMKRFLRIYY